MTTESVRVTQTRWQPHARQQEVYRLIAQAPIGSRSLIGYGGAAGGGKTMLLAQLAYDLAASSPQQRILVGRKQMVDLKTTTLEEFDRSIHPSLIAKKYDSHPVYRDVKHPDWPEGVTSRIYFRDVLKARDSIGSEAYSWILLEESHEIAEEDILYLFSRLRWDHAKKWGMVFAFNPWPSFVVRLFMTKKGIDTAKLDAAGVGRVYFVQSLMTDNPGLDAGYESFLRAMYPKPMADRLIDGKPGATENAIYGHFDRALHVVDRVPPGVIFGRGAFGEDYGERHDAAVVAVRVDQWNRKWVLDAWAEPSEDHGKSLARIVATFRQKYHLTTGRADPNQDVLAGYTGADVADRGAGTRNHRTVLLGRLFNLFDGGRVPTWKAESRGYTQYGPYAEQATPGLFIVRIAENAEFIDLLCEQLEAYQFVNIESPSRDAQVVRRVFDDLVAALEYAIEALEEGASIFSDGATSMGSLGVQYQ